MFAAFLITLREGLEAALIVGTILSALRKLGRVNYMRSVWWGVGAAGLASIGIGLIMNALGMAFEGRGEKIFEGLAMLLAAGILTWMILWMQRPSRGQNRGQHIQQELERDVNKAMQVGRPSLLFGLAFVTVVREGIETVLFLTAAAFSSTSGQILVGGTLGLLVAIGLGWLMFAASKRLNLRAFFQVTGFLLVLFAAGLLAHGIHELQEASLLPIIVEHVWDINPILDENSTVGGLLKALFGYNGNPSLLEVLSYIGYIAIAWLLRQGLWPVRRVSTASQ